MNKHPRRSWHSSWHSSDYLDLGYLDPEEIHDFDSGSLDISKILRDGIHLDVDYELDTRNGLQWQSVSYQSLVWKQFYENRLWILGPGAAPITVNLKRLREGT